MNLKWLSRRVWCSACLSEWKAACLLEVSESWAESDGDEQGGRVSLTASIELSCSTLHVTSKFDRGATVTPWPITLRVQNPRRMRISGPIPTSLSQGWLHNGNALFHSIFTLTTEIICSLFQRGAEREGCDQVSGPRRSGHTLHTFRCPTSAPKIRTYLRCDPSVEIFKCSSNLIY